MKIPIAVGVSGRFQIIPHGDRASPAYDNTFTLSGSAFYASRGPNFVSVGVSELGGMFATSSNLVEAVVSRRTLGDESGNGWWRKTYRFAFPIDPLGGLRRIRSVSAMLTGGPIDGTVFSGIASVAPLRNLGGEPTEVVIDTSVEGFDLVWQFTEYVKLHAEGSVTINVQDGLGNLVSSSTHSYVLRPANFSNTSDTHKGWASSENASFPSFGSSSAFKIGTGTIGYETSEPTFEESYNAPIVEVGSAFSATGRGYVEAMFGFDESGESETFNCAQMFLGHSEWQMQFDPPIRKSKRHRMNMRFVIAANNGGN